VMEFFDDNIDIEELNLEGLFTGYSNKVVRDKKNEISQKVNTIHELVRVNQGCYSQEMLNEWDSFVTQEIAFINSSSWWNDDELLDTMVIKTNEWLTRFRKDCAPVNEALKQVEAIKKPPPPKPDPINSALTKVIVIVGLVLGGVVGYKVYQAMRK
jgi:hypothetical protein